MADHATCMGNVTQTQLPPTAAERAARKNLPGKVFRHKALQSRRVSNQSLENMRVVELLEDLSYAQAEEDSDA